MARRKKTSPLEDLIEVLSLLPWWVCVVLGLISYLALHALARPVAMTGIRPDQIGQAMTQAVWKGLANVGQYLVPIVCFGAAVMSAIGRRKRRDLLLQTPHVGMVGGVTRTRLYELGTHDLQTIDRGRLPLTTTSYKAAAGTSAANC